MNKPIKLNLGSGSSPMDGYRNLDIKTCHEIYPLRNYADGSADEVRASHILEHFPHGQIAEVVKEWARVLKPGGRLKIAVPDFDFIVKAYSNGHRDDFRLEHYLFGGQTDADDFHKAFFNEDKLKKILEDAGLQDIKRWESDAPDCSSYYVSLNLEGTKPELKHIAIPAYDFLKDARGVIHVGANSGQERDIYARHNLHVLWIEGLYEAFQQLGHNIQTYPNQRAIHSVISDEDGKVHTFHVANNDGQSSSLFDFGEHTRLWPEIEYTHSFETTGTTLKTTLQRYAVNLSDYDTLIMDVQGAELLVLKGAGDLLDKFKFIRAEACDFELYKGACTLQDLDDYLAPRGFERALTWHYRGSDKEKVAHIFEALYQKKATPRPLLDPIYIEDPQSGASAIYRIGAVANVPRLGFQAHKGVLEESFSNPKIFTLRGGSAFWEQSMQELFNSIIDQGADYLITVDYDSIFTSRDVKALLQLIVRYPHADAIAAWQPSRWKKHQALAGVRSDDKWGGQYGIEEMKRTDLTPVHNTVYGLTIIKTSAILKVAKPWFLNVPNEQGEWREGKQDADSYFWRKFVDAGNKVYMANRVRIGHLHEDVLWLDDDFNLHKQDLTDWYGRGRPF